jgi:hypothetical protein
MRYRCPFCDREPYLAFYVLRKHARASYARDNRHPIICCPACGASVKSLIQHAWIEAIRDKPGGAHRVLYGLIAPAHVTGGERGKLLKKQCIQEAILACSRPGPGSPEPGRELPMGTSTRAPFGPVGLGSSLTSRLDSNSYLFHTGTNS